MSFTNWFMTGEMVNNSALTKFARTFASNLSLGLELEKGVDQPRTNSRVLYMPQPTYGMDEEGLVLWLYKFYHEIGHNDPEMSDIFLLLREKKIQQSFLSYLLNLLDDHRQELHGHGKYTGRDYVMGEGRNLFMSSMDTSDYGQTGADLHRQAAETMWVWDTMIRTDWMPQLMLVGERMAESLNEQQVVWLDKLSGGDYESTLKSGITAEEEYNLVLKIIEEVFEFDAEEEEQNATESGEEGEEAEDGQGDSDGDAGTAGEVSRKGKDGGTKKTDTGKVREVDYSDITMHDHMEQNHSGYGIHVNYDALGTGHFVMAEEKDYNIHDYTKGAEVVAHSSVKRGIDSIDEGAGLSKQVRRLLMAKKAARYQHGLKRGRISPKSIYRAGMKGGGEYQKKVFRKKQDTMLQDAAVVVVLDCSGSMSGEKFYHGAKSLLMLNEALGGLKIPTLMFGFSDEEYAPIHTVYKSFDKAVTYEDLLDRLSDSYSRTMRNNSDGEAVMWAYNRVKSRPEKRKLVVVLSDGSPCTHRGDSDWHTQLVVDNIQSEAIVELYGIGIMDRNVERFYANNVVINSANELEGALLGVIKNHLI